MASPQEAVSPRPLAGEGGRIEPDWWCRNLLLALYLMVYLDKSGHSEYRRCDAPGCPCACLQAGLYWAHNGETVRWPKSG